MNRILPLLLLGACAEASDLSWEDPEAWGATALHEGDALDALPGGDDAALPPPALDIAVSMIETGFPARASVGPMPRGLTVHWAFSIAGPGAGPCPAVLNGTCLDIVQPNYLGATRSRVGYASTSIQVPPVPQGFPIWVQAIVEDPNGRPAVASPVYERITGPVACPLIFAPVCGVNGVTYGNDCEAETAGWLVDYAGPC